MRVCVIALVATYSIGWKERISAAFFISTCPTRRVSFSANSSFGPVEGCPFYLGSDTYIDAGLGRGNAIQQLLWCSGN